MKKLVVGLIFLSLIFFTVGFLLGVIYENISLNNKIESKIENLSESPTPIFKIGNEYYYINKYNRSIYDPTSRIIEYPIK